MRITAVCFSPACRAAKQIRTREEQRQQRHAGQPQRQQEPAHHAAAAGVVLQHHAQEAQRPQLDPLGPLAEDQMDDDRNRQGREGPQESDLDEGHGQWSGVEGRGSGVGGQ